MQPEELHRPHYVWHCAAKSGKQRERYTAPAACRQLRLHTYLLQLFLLLFRRDAAMHCELPLLVHLTRRHDDSRQVLFLDARVSVFFVCCCFMVIRPC